MKPRNNIADLISDNATNAPNQVCLVESKKGDGSDLVYRQITYGNFAEQVNQATTRLTAMGIEPGMKTLIAMPATPDFFALVFALLKTGAVPVFIDPRIGISNLRLCLRELQPDVLIGSLKARFLLRLLTNIKIKLSSTSCLQGRTTTLFPSYQPQTKDMAAIIFTSGSTGLPKGVVYTHQVFAAQLQALQKMFAIEKTSYDLATFPLFALFGPLLGRTTVLPLMDMTRPATVQPRFLVAAIEKFDTKSMFCSPAVLDKLANYGQAHRLKLPQLQQVICAGAPVNPRILAAFSSLLPDTTQVFTPYGATEALPLTVIGSDTILTETQKLTATGKGICVGQPVASVDIRIVTSDTEDAPAGVVGEIAVSAPWLSVSYYRRPDADRAARIFRQGTRYHRMGDLGYIDKQGQLWYCGRKSQCVETEGGKLYTVCVEGIFNNTVPVIKRSALVAVRVAGKRRAAICLELTRKLSRREKRVLRKKLAALHFPQAEQIVRFFFFATLPVDKRHNAKILRPVLQQRVAKMI